MEKGSNVSGVLSTMTNNTNPPKRDLQAAITELKSSEKDILELTASLISKINLRVDTDRIDHDRRLWATLLETENIVPNDEDNAFRKRYIAGEIDAETLVQYVVDRLKSKESGSH